MYKRWMTPEVKREITTSIARVVVHATEPCQEGRRLSGYELKVLAEDAGTAILAGLVKAGIAEAGDVEGAVDDACGECGGAGEIRRPYSAGERMPCPICWADKVADWFSNPEQRSTVRSILEAHAAQSRSRAPSDCKSESSESRKTTWLIEVGEGGVQMTRLHNGNPCEVYPVVSHAKAVIYASAVIQGYQPPRDLRDQGKPVG